MSNRISESQIRDLVFSFYGRVREDESLAPIFESRLAGRWDPHLERMCDFWSGILLATGRFRGNAVEAHRGIQGIEPAHFDRWLELFEETAHATLPTTIAVDVVGRSRNMRLTLEAAACPQQET